MGYDHESFWDQTPHTLSLTFQAANELLIDEHNGRAWTAWHIAALQRSQRLPHLRTLQTRRAKPQTIEEQLEGLKNWVKAAGGKVVYNG